jgi:hypothetical protein
MSTLDHSQRYHYLLGGSSAERWIECYGSVALNQDKGSDENEHTIRGNKGHEVLEQVCREALRQKETGLADEILLGEGQTLEMLDDAECAFETIWKEIFGQTIVGRTWEIEGELIIDRELHMGGTSDLWVVYRDDRARLIGFINDYKYGHGEVEAENNVQLLFYAVALFVMLRDQYGKILEEVYVSIYQPSKGQPFSQVKVTQSSLERWEKKFKKAAYEIVVKKSTKLKAGKWCKWCKVREECAENLKAKNKLLQIQMADPELVMPPFETLTEEQHINLAKHASDIKKFLSDHNKYLINRYINNAPVSDQLKLVQSKTKRKWCGKPEELVGELLQFEGVDITDVADYKLKGLGHVSTVLKQKAGLSKKDADEVVDTLCFKPPGKVSVVDIKDPRPAVVPTENLLAALNNIDEDEIKELEDE